VLRDFRLALSAGAGLRVGQPRVTSPKLQAHFPGPATVAGSFDGCAHHRRVAVVCGASAGTNRSDLGGWTAVGGGRGTPVACRCPRGLEGSERVGTVTGLVHSGDSVRIASSTRSLARPGSLVSRMMPPLASLRSWKAGSRFLGLEFRI
jgi:hypothetical protein